ncbi:hypothetical protein [Mycobacterium scrofulaceum]|nr:hypothetical protein [Mycobacterium scrofulaceum]
MSPNDFGVDTTATAKVKIPLLALENTWSIAADRARALLFNGVGAI